MKEQILTAYGPVELEVRRIADSRIYVANERCVFPAGTKTRGNEILKKDFAIPRGAVLVPAWEDFDGKKPERLHRVFSGGLYEAMRGATHAIRKYGLRDDPGEIQILRTISDQTATSLGVLMHGNLASRRELATVRRNLAKLAAKLGRPIDEMKAQAAEKIAAASTLQIQHPSGTRSENIPATRERLRAAKRRIDKRLETVHQIGPRVGFFEQVLAQAIGRIFSDLESLRDNLSKERFYIGNGFSQKVREIFTERADSISERLLPQLDAEPFLKTARMIRVDLAKARAARGRKFALEAVDRILASVRIKRAQRLLEGEIILPFALNCDLGVVTAWDFTNTKFRLGNFAYHFNRKINDAGFIRPIKARVLKEIRAIIDEEFNDEPNAERLKERLKAVSRML